MPRTAGEVATELRELLEVEGIAGPYVLVAHSLGGAYAHRFAQLYPAEVAGLMWLDGFRGDYDRFMPAEVSLAAGVRRPADDPVELSLRRASDPGRVVRRTGWRQSRLPDPETDAMLNQLAGDGDIPIRSYVHRRQRHGKADLPD